MKTIINMLINFICIFGTIILSFINFIFKIIFNITSFIGGLITFVGVVGIGVMIFTHGIQEPNNLLILLLISVSGLLISNIIIVPIIFIKYLKEKLENCIS